MTIQFYLKMEVDNEAKLDISIKEEEITIDQKDLRELQLPDDYTYHVKTIKLEEKSSDPDYVINDLNSTSSSEDEKVSKSIMYFCQYCTFKTKYGGNLKQHQNSLHLGKVELCQFCGRKYKDRSNLNRHIRIEHLKFKRYIQAVQMHNCIYCDFTTNRKENLQTHLNSLHTLENIFSCKFCSYVGTRIDSYRRHMQAIHTPKKKHYECTRCSFKTLRRDLFDLHFSEDHKEIKIFPCKFCHYRATFACNLRRHIQRKHS
ncbi:zinc finger Y-chromosomal protein-like [Harmonia axyridis]|uniref:zinc finger Y-chromosomal protein-like n=1 Tax=Harmonia axyridis TaxID=115357 RepID=UPI001E2797A7|nr:zinc finger Y-chromosomal protein-like [Harmonia axyridis]